MCSYTLWLLPLVSVYGNYKPLQQLVFQAVCTVYMCILIEKYSGAFLFFIYLFISA